MKLWILRPVGYETSDTQDIKGTPWDPRYDCTFGVVVRAKTEWEARTFADKEGGNEQHQTGGPIDYSPSFHAYVWLDSALTTCVELDPDGEPGVVMVDFHAA